jgi:hypothetical protein
MALRFDKAPRFKGVEQRLSEGLFHIGERLKMRRASASRPLRLFKPIAVYALGRTAKISTNAPRWRKTGLWRSLVVDGDSPIALIQFRQPMTSNSTLVRGADSANALFRALEIADRFAREQTHDFTIRFVILPHLFITGLWLTDSRSHAVFIPTRTGSAHRPDPEIYSKVEFLKLVLRRHRAVARSQKAFARRKKAMDKSSRPGRTTTT